MSHQPHIATGSHGDGEAARSNRRSEGSFCLRKVNRAFRDISLVQLMQRLQEHRSEDDAAWLREGVLRKPCRSISLRPDRWGCSLVLLLWAQQSKHRGATVPRTTFQVASPSGSPFKVDGKGAHTYNMSHQGLMGGIGHRHADSKSCETESEALVSSLQGFWERKMSLGERSDLSIAQ